MSIGIISPYISILTSPEKISEEKLWQSFNSLFGINEIHQSITVLSLLIVVLFIIKGVIAYWIQRKIVRYSMDKQSELVSKLMSAYQEMPYYFHIKRNSASLIQAITEHISNFSHQTLIASLRLISELIVLFLILILLSFTNFFAMIAVSFVLSVVYLLYDKIVKDKIHRAGQKAAETNEGIIKGVNQGIGGLKEIRIFGRENYFHNKVSDYAAEYAEVSSQYQALKIIPRYLFEISIVSLTIIFCIIIFNSGNNFVEYLPSLGMFAIAAMRLIPSANQISTAVTSMRFSVFSLNQLYDDLNEINKMSLNSKIMDIKDRKGIRSANSNFSKIEIKEISYRYPDADSYALSDLSLNIEQGQSIGLIGQSGSGKTTLVNVLLGLLTPEKGVIEVDKIPINKNLRSWMNLIAYIPQDGFIIDDTIRRNIAFGIFDKEIDEKKMMESLQTAQLKNMVSELPKGLNNNVGENGMMLSGGERQRVALARSFYHEREIIIMDEATASLDNDTELQLVEAINEFKEGKTMIIIAHRLSTVKNCDIIYKLDQGRIINSGSLESLVETT